MGRQTARLLSEGCCPEAWSIHGVNKVNIILYICISFAILQKYKNLVKEAGLCCLGGRLSCKVLWETLYDHSCEETSSGSNSWLFVRRGVLQRWHCAARRGGLCIHRVQATQAKGDPFDVLLWWKEHAKTFPNMAIILLNVLSIPASSAASERDFPRLDLWFKNGELFL